MKVPRDLSGAELLKALCRDWDYRVVNQEEKAGRKKGSGKKTEICLSVTEKTWNYAVKLWKKKPSWLVDGLLSRYTNTGGSILKMEAAI